MHRHKRQHARRQDQLAMYMDLRVERFGTGFVQIPFCRLSKALVGHHEDDLLLNICNGLLINDTGWQIHWSRPA
jgi:hypothetical protein